MLSDLCAVPEEWVRGVKDRASVAAASKLCDCVDVPEGRCGLMGAWDGTAAAAAGQGDVTAADTESFAATGLARAGDALSGTADR